MRFVWPSFIALALATSSASCMFFRSLDELREQGVDAQSEAGPGGPDGGALDADAAAGDATDLPDSSRVSPCTPGHTYVLCADFDDGPITRGFDGEDKGAVGTLTLSDAQAASAPFSALLVNPALASGAPELRNALTLENPGVFSRVRLDFDIFVKPPTADAGQLGVAFVVILLRDGNVTTGTVISLSELGETVMSIESASSEYFIGPKLPLNRWIHVSLDFKRSGTYDYSIDGVPGSRTFSAVTLNGGSPRASLSLGMHTFNGPAFELGTYYDNVAYDLE